MTRVEFLNHLEKRLEILNKKERDDLLEEYAQHIENKMSEGMTEEEAVRDLGDIDELADEILEAYNVDPEYDRTQRVEKTVISGVSQLGRMINQLASQLMRKNARELFALLVRLCVVGAVLLGVYLVLDVVKNAVMRVFSFLPHLLYSPLYGLFDLIVLLFMLVLAAVALYNFVGQEFFPRSEEEEEPSANQSTNNGFRMDQEAWDAAAGRERSRFFSRLPRLPHMPRRSSQWQAPTGEGEEESSRRSGLGFLGSLCRALWRLFILCVMLPFAFCEILAVVAVGVLLVLMLQGYPLIGVTLGLLGCAMCGMSFLLLVARWLLGAGGERDA
ncbi:MAG: DUF1700 domain-containing protein [Eubacteriales bacterium]|jgi:uncharacterized membrane protein